MAAQAFTGFAGNPGSNQPTGYASADGFVGAPATPFNPNSPSFNPASFPSGAHGVSATASLSLPVTAVASTALTMSLPTGAIIQSMTVYTTTAYTGTTVTIQIGSAAAGSQYVAATTIKTVGVYALTPVSAGAAGLLSLPAGTPNFFITIAQTGATAVGAATLVVSYTLP